MSTTGDTARSASLRQHNYLRYSARINASGEKGLRVKIETLAIHRRAQFPPYPRAGNLAARSHDPSQSWRAMRPCMPEIGARHVVFSYGAIHYRRAILIDQCVACAFPRHLLFVALHLLISGAEWRNVARM